MKEGHIAQLILSLSVASPTKFVGPWALVLTVPVCGPVCTLSITLLKNVSLLLCPHKSKNFKQSAGPGPRQTLHLMQ